MSGLVHRGVPGSLAELVNLFYRVSATFHVDLSVDYRTSTLVTSSGRSGSTWLADIINYKNEYRMIFEPFRRDRSPTARDIRYGLYLDPAVCAAPEAPAIEAILRGRVRTAYSEQRNKRVARRRIVKDIRTTNLIPWITSCLPGLPVVYLLRHPFAVARSWTRLRWSDFLEEFMAQPLLLARLSEFRPLIDEALAHGTVFERHVLRWCLENYVPVHDGVGHGVHVVFYEDLVDDPAAEIRRLFDFLGKEFEPRALERVRVPSATVFADEAPTSDGMLETKRAAEIVAGFRLDRLYGTDGRPSRDALWGQ